MIETHAIDHGIFMGVGADVKLAVLCTGDASDLGGRRGNDGRWHVGLAFNMSCGAMEPRP